MHGKLYRITAPHFCAGFVFGVAYAPILRWMRTRSLLEIQEFCFRKGWRLELVE